MQMAQAAPFEAACYRHYVNLAFGVFCRYQGLIESSLLKLSKTLMVPYFGVLDILLEADFLLLGSLPLGILPYINASIIIHHYAAIPALENYRK